MTALEELKALKELGAVPVDMGTLKSIFHEYKSPEKKVQALEQAGKLMKVKRGLYVVSPQVTRKTLYLELIANHLYGPSYVSLHYALRHYGLIPERVFLITSVTTRHTRMFETPLANFSYRGVAKDYFPIGIRSEEAEGIAYMIATPEKALCDMLMQERYVPDQSVSRLEVFFEEDMRIEIDDIRQMDTRIIRACMETGNKKKILANLLKLMER
jgi:predicted transcriptional regulator of viral defense system